ncbi:MAG: hypothetical protein ACJAXU_001163, partial [Paracoccaceae bacterium]
MIAALIALKQLGRQSTIYCRFLLKRQAIKVCH